MTAQEAIKRAIKGADQGYPIEALEFLARWLKKMEQDEAVKSYLTWSSSPRKGS